MVTIHETSKGCRPTANGWSMTSDYLWSRPPQKASWSLARGGPKRLRGRVSLSDRSGMSGLSGFVCLATSGFSTAFEEPA